MPATMMRAIQVHQYGGPEQLKIEQVPRPKPQSGEVLVRVHAAGVLPIETVVRQGQFANFMPQSFPYTPGTAFSGVVEAIGDGVTSFRVGDAVCGRSPRGTYAEYTTVQTDAPALEPTSAAIQQKNAIVPLAIKPKSLGFDEAATLSGGATTAWTALFEDGALQGGQRILIHAAAGGVGLFAVQFARWKGAHVIGTCSSSNVRFVRSLGAETVIDYTTTAFEDVVRDVDFVFDTVGGDTLQRSYSVVKPGGTLVSITSVPSPEMAQEYGIRAIKNAVPPNSAHLRAIVDMIDAGHVRPCIRQSFALHEAPLAHALSERGHGRGRIVLHIAD